VSTCGGTHPVSAEPRDEWRRRAVEQAHQRLTAGVARLVDGEQWQAILAAAARFHAYSWRNVLLILAQRPGATRLAGYRTWQALGRQVRRGEHGIGVLAPITYRPKLSRDSWRCWVGQCLAGVLPGHCLTGQWLGEGRAAELERLGCPVGSSPTPPLPRSVTSGEPAGHRHPHTVGRISVRCRCRRSLHSHADLP
jgi:hypothetical protein